ncbi:hypothetical protein J437_LFUL003327 [Ladona fulva]|uniref:Uncharacterized protein n=1 Tax=Ladona fulva TaxID=123851 RepID=A0A8K0K7G4_LADFU|nr:hypothetical protein J437_LFUL003327 [Ladona fulva]
MSDTYQRIQAQSDVEWKYGLAKLIRNMHRTTTTPSPLNLVTTWLMFFLRTCHQKVVHRKRPSLVQMMGLQQRSRSSARTKMGAKWLSKVKKGQAQSDVEWKYGLAKLIRNMHRTTTTPSPLNLVTTWLMFFLRTCHQKDSVGLSVVHLSPLGSQLSFNNSQRIENVADWEAIAKKYRQLMGEDVEHDKTPSPSRGQNSGNQPGSATSRSSRPARSDANANSMGNST